MEQRYKVGLTRSDYAAGLGALMAELARLDSGRRRMLFARLGLTIVILLVIAYAFPLSASALFTAILMFWIGDAVLAKLFATQIVGISFDPEAHASTELLFAEEAIVETGATRVRRWSWPALRRIHRPPGYVVLEMIGWDMIILPNRLWTDEDSREAFIGALRARRQMPTADGQSSTPEQAVTSLKLVEPVLLARIALTVALLQAVFEQFLPVGGPPGQARVFTGLGLGLLVGAIAWWGSGRLFRSLAARSPRKALWAAWGLFILLAAVFALWYYQRM